MPFLKSLVWHDLGLNPGLPNHWQTLYPLGQWAGVCVYIYIYIYIFLLLAPLSDVFYIAENNALTFYYWYCSSPWWPELLDNFIFWSSTRFSKWSFLVPWIIIKKVMVVICETCKVCGQVGLLLLVLWDHVLPSNELPNFGCAPHTCMHNSVYVCVYIYIYIYIYGWAVWYCSHVKLGRFQS